MFLKYVKYEGSIAWSGVLTLSPCTIRTYGMYPRHFLRMGGTLCVLRNPRARAPGVATARGCARARGDGDDRAAP